MASIVSQDQDILFRPTKQISSTPLSELSVRDSIFIVNCATEEQWEILSSLTDVTSKLPLQRFGLGNNGWIDVENERFKNPHFLIVYKVNEPHQFLAFSLVESKVYTIEELEREGIKGFVDNRIVYEAKERIPIEWVNLPSLVNYFKEYTNWKPSKPLFVKGAELIKPLHKKKNKGNTTPSFDEWKELTIDEAIASQATQQDFEEDALTSFDLFSGCGGLTKGFSMAGVKSIFASDIDINCEKTFTRNFKEVPFLCKDITEITRDEVEELTGGKEPDIIIGGPPCQGFSLANKRRNKIADDPRNRLFYGFVKFLNWYSPKIFVMENVKGLLSMQGGAVFSTILEELKSSGSYGGYEVNVKVLNASDYGVPQNRERVIFIGFRKDLHIIPEFPLPLEDRKITVDEAISDLPQIKASEGKEVMDYITSPQNSFQEKMRANSKYVFNHIAMRHTPRLIERFKAIKPGESLVDVWETHGAVKRGAPSEKSDVKFGQNNQRLHGDKPAPTIAASFQSNFIHPYLNRNFTAREGARLQSFPDDFIFEGMRTKMSWERGLSQYQQIGNAVPVLLAYSIANKIKEQFTEYGRK